LKNLYALAEVLALRVIDRHARRLRGRIRRVTIDLDPTDDPTHGAQQLSFFNGHYDTWCYPPVMGFLSFKSRRTPDTAEHCGGQAFRELHCLNSRRVKRPQRRKEAFAKALKKPIECLIDVAASATVLV
jgi:hypothetical protein